MTIGLTGRELEKYHTAVILTDGSVLHLRPIRPDDEQKLLAFFYRLSSHTVYLRFHHVLTSLSREEARRFCDIDYQDSYALVGIMGEGAEEKIVAVSRYYRLGNGNRAEVAFTVEEKYQGKGIGTHLMEQMARFAREKGISIFDADVLPENDEMLKVFRDSGFRLAEKLTSGVYRMVMDVSPAETAIEKSLEREKVAIIASLRAFLQPRSIAVIGASRRPDTIGNKLFHNLMRGEFKGVAYPVNPNTDYVASVRAYPSVLDIPWDVDMAVIIVNAEHVQEIVEQCGHKGVHGLVVISAGFAELGEKGKERQEKLLQTAYNYGMRVIGPNCMGVINTGPQVSMNATFSSVFPGGGNVGMCSQSGALGLAILEYAQSLNLGLSTFVSIGDRADISSNDLLYYWEQDPATRVVLLYLESFGNPRKFARIARMMTKPVVAVKSGRTPAGSRAAASHTGALATTEVVSEALFAQAGLIRVDTLEELFDMANLLVNQPIPGGRKTVILTNGGGPGAMTADACAERGLDVSPLSQNSIDQLKQFASPRASLGNPVDITAEAGAEDYRRVLDILVRDDSIDIVIVIFVPPIVVKPEEVAAAIRAIAPEYRRRNKTIVASFMGLHGRSVELGSEESCCVPAFNFPESTALALSKACEYGEWMKRPKGNIPVLSGIDRERARRVIDSALSAGDRRPRWLNAVETGDILECYGISQAPARLAQSPDEAGIAARELGFPVALKLFSSTIRHKTEVGGVILDLRTGEELAQAYRKIQENLAGQGKAAEMQGVLVQKMVTGGVEVIIGVTQDQSFGPLIMFGLGGIYAELFKDVTFRIHPLTDVDAREMLRAVKAYQLLSGWRGAPPADIAAVEDLLLRVSAMVEDIPQISELDLNPVEVLEKGYAAVDARLMIA